MTFGWPLKDNLLSPWKGLCFVPPVKDAPPMRKKSKACPPMPSEEELEERFNKVILHLDLSPEKEKALRNISIEKKWEIVSDHEQMSSKDPPSLYVKKIRIFLDSSAPKTDRKILGDASSTQVLRDLEVSLRTNHIEWVHQFLSQENGLYVLIEFLSSRLSILKQQQELEQDENIHEVSSASFSFSESTKSTPPINKKKMDVTRKEFQKLEKREKDRKLGDPSEDVLVSNLLLICINLQSNTQQLLQDHNRNIEIDSDPIPGSPSQPLKTTR